MGWDKLSSSTPHMMKLFHFYIIRVAGKNVPSGCLLGEMGLWALFYVGSPRQRPARPKPRLTLRRAALLN